MNSDENSTLEKVKSVAGKAKNAINKLPFNNLAQNVPALAKFAGYANYSVCALVLFIVVLAGCGGKSSKRIPMLDLKSETEPSEVMPAWALNEYYEDYHEADDVQSAEPVSPPPTKPTANWSAEAQEAFKVAKEAPASDLRYELTDDGEGVKIVRYTGLELNISIPAELGGMPVRELEEGVFNHNERVRTVSCRIP